MFVCLDKYIYNAGILCFCVLQLLLVNSIHFVEWRLDGQNSVFSCFQRNYRVWCISTNERCRFIHDNAAMINVLLPLLWCSECVCWMYTHRVNVFIQRRFSDSFTNQLVHMNSLDKKRKQPEKMLLLSFLHSSNSRQWKQIGHFFGDLSDRIWAGQQFNQTLFIYFTFHAISAAQSDQQMTEKLIMRQKSKKTKQNKSKNNT